MWPFTRTPKPAPRKVSVLLSPVDSLTHAALTDDYMAKPKNQDNYLWVQRRQYHARHLPVPESWPPGLKLERTSELDVATGCMRLHLTEVLDS